MKVYISYLSIFIILLFGCNVNPTEVKKGLPFVIFKLSNNIDIRDSSGNEGLVIRFYENGTYSHFGYNFFSYGSWQWDENKKTINLSPVKSKDNNYIQQFKIEQTLKEKFTIKKVIIQNGKTLIERYENAAIGLGKPTSKDPFSKELNTWRFKPLRPESKQEIKLRTLNYLQFLLAYNDFIVENKIHALTYRWYATPIQMNYDNGIRMAYNNELADWYSCFYSVDEANEAYKLIAMGMRKSKIAEAESIAKRNADYVKQLIVALK